jgi:hypothetical protein
MHPTHQLGVDGLEAGLGPDAFFPLAPGGQGVEAPIAAEFEIEEEERQGVSLL